MSLENNHNNKKQGKTQSGRELIVLSPRKWKKMTKGDCRWKKKEKRRDWDERRQNKKPKSVNWGQFFFFARGSVFEIQRSFALEFLKLCFYSKTTKNERNKNNNIYERKKKKNFKTEIGDKERERERNDKSGVLTTIKKKKQRRDGETSWRFW